MTRTFLQDMLEQPNALEQVASFYSSKTGENLFKLVSQLGAGKYKNIIFSGMGSSLAVSRFAATYLWSVGKQAWYVEASELLHYGLDALIEDTLFVLISQSGESVEIRQILDILPKETNVIGITNNMESTLAQKSSIVLPILTGEESTTSSKTYTASLAVVFLVAQILAGLHISDVLSCIKNASKSLLKLIDNVSNEVVEKATEKLKKAKAIHLIGRGPGVSTAIQGALTIKELVKIQAECMEAAQFRHGPLETVDQDTVVVVVASPGRTDSLLLSFASELQSIGATVFVIREGILYENFTSLAEEAVTKAQGCNEFSSALVDIYPIQAIANMLAEQLGRTGEFKWITKVTIKE